MTPQTNTPQDGGDELADQIYDAILGMTYIGDVQKSARNAVPRILQLIQARERAAEKRGAIQGADFANNCLYDNCPTSDVSAWDMLKGVQKTQNQLSELVQQLHPKPQAGDGDIELTPHYQKVATTRAKSATAEEYEPEFTEVDDGEGA